MMARFLIAALVALAVYYSDACTSSSGRTPAWDIGDNAEIYPFYRDGAVGVGVTVRFRRDTDGKREVFNLIDADNNNYIYACEWISEGGSVQNFVEFLQDDDINGDEKISWEEFQKVSVTSEQQETRQTNNQ